MNKTDVKKVKERAKSGNNQNDSKICVKKQFGKACEFCPRVSHLYERADELGDDSIKDIANSTRAKSSFAMNVIPMKKKKNQGKPTILMSGITIWQELIDLLPEDDNDPDGVDFTDAKKCYVIIITRRGKGLNTRYSVKKSEEYVKLDKKTLKNLNNLSKLPEQLQKDPNIDVLTLEEGKNRLLIMPPWDEKGLFYKELHRHWNTDKLIEATSDLDKKKGKGKDKKKGKDKESGKKKGKVEDNKKGKVEDNKKGKVEDKKKGKDKESSKKKGKVEGNKKGKKKNNDVPPF